MFNSQRTSYMLYRGQKTVDKKFNQEITDYQPLQEIQAFISLNSSQFNRENPQRVLNCEYVGVTSHRDLVSGDRIGDYLIKYVVPHGNDIFFYCNRYE